MPLEDLDSLGSNLSDGVNAISKGDVAGASSNLSDAFGNIFQFVGAGLFTFAFVQTIRNKELAWYEKLIPATMYALSAATSIAAGVTMALAVAAAVPILSFIGSTFTFLRNTATYFAEKWEARRIKKDLKNKEEVERIVSRLGVPNNLLDKLDRAQAHLRKFNRLPDKLFESDPQTVREMCEMLSMDEASIAQFVEASEITEKIKKYQIPEKLRNDIMAVLVYKKEQSHLTKKQMRNLMVRVINHTVNVNHMQQEKIHDIMKTIPYANAQDFDDTIDQLCMPSDKLREYRNFIEQPGLQASIRQMLRDKDLAEDWLHQPHKKLKKELKKLGFNGADRKILLNAYAQYQLPVQYKLPEQLKVDLKQYLQLINNSESPADKQKASKFLAKFSEYFASSDKAAKTSPLYTLLFETPDVKFESPQQWMTEVTRQHQERTKQEFKSNYGKLFRMFERRQRLHHLIQSKAERIKIIAWSGVAAFVSALATFIPLGLLATPAAPAAAPVYGALSAAAAAPAAVAAFKGANLAWRGHKLEGKVRGVEERVDDAMSPVVDDFVHKVQREQKHKQSRENTQQMEVSQPGVFRRMASAIGGFFSGLFSTASSAASVQREEEQSLLNGGNGRGVEEAEQEASEPAVRVRTTSVQPRRPKGVTTMYSTSQHEDEAQPRVESEEAAHLATHRAKPKGKS